MNRVHLIPVAVALAIAGIFAAGSYMVRPTATAVCDPTRDVFLVRQHREPGASVRAVTFFKVRPKADEGEVELGTIEGYSVGGNYYHDRKGRILFFANESSRQSLYVYSICAGKLQKAIDLPEADRAITSARYVGDADTLLVATRDDGEPAELATNARLEVYEQGKRSASPTFRRSLRSMPWLRSSA